ncbi:MAG: ACT domain-containing protein, partial [Lachnospiraceae bacterium]|nr:ACT domain-containing protein [Lachnospiraceae bacterium]
NDRTGLLVDVSRMLTENNIPIRSMNTWTSRQGLATMETSFEIGSTVQLRAIIDKLRMVEGVIDVERQ